VCKILLIIYDVVDKANTSERLEKDSNPRTGSRMQEAKSAVLQSSVSNPAAIGADD
jgi:hypothetical protein